MTSIFLVKLNLRSFEREGTPVSNYPSKSAAIIFRDEIYDRFNIRRQTFQTKNYLPDNVLSSFKRSRVTLLYPPFIFPY